METGLTVSVVLLWIVVLFNLVLTLALIRRANPGPQAAQSGLKKGQAAPDFTAQTLSGERVTLADYKHPTAFVFISSNCSPCRLLLPELEELGPQAAQSDVDLVLVSGDRLEETQDYAKEKNIHLPVLVAPRDENPFFTDYQITGTPYCCYIDEQGMIQVTGYPIANQAWSTLTASWAKNAIRA